MQTRSPLHWVKLVQATQAVPAALQTWPPVHPVSVPIVHEKPGTGGAGGSGDTARVHVPFWQVVAVVAPGIEHNVPFALARHRHRTWPDLVFFFTFL
jgi:hypothetical protein